MCDFREITKIKIDGKIVDINYIGSVDRDWKVLDEKSRKTWYLKDPSYIKDNEIKVGLYMNIGTGSGYQFYFDGQRKRTDWEIVEYEIPECLRCGSI